MTPFEKWCEKNGYDLRGDFVVIEGGSGLSAGDLVSLAYDDGTGMPSFNTPVGKFYISAHRLTQHKTEPKMTERKLPIPRMVEVRDREHDEWKQRELLADLSEFGVKAPFCCRDQGLRNVQCTWRYMREIPQPKTRPMTPRELLDAIRNGAVWRYAGGESVCAYWYSEMRQDFAKELCYDWHGTDSDVWVKAEVTE